MGERKAPPRRVIIITDLDGTLLHHRTYSFEEAKPALELIRQRGIPLVICSSKTRAEIEVYRERLENGHPFISENGGGIYIPAGYFPGHRSGEIRDGYEVIALGAPYAEIRKRLAALRERLGTAVRGFGDMSAEEVAALTGLTVEEARLAKHRDFEEPFIFTGEPDERFLRELEGEKLRWTQGRYFHLMGDHHKGRAVNILRRLYERSSGPVMTIGIGDSLNDLPFLLAVDRPVLVRKGSGRHDARIDVPGLVRTEGIGPAGWNEAILEMLG
ncbi:MAG: HAD-IIB family hydrolase [Nitrospirota bacterium]